MVKPFIMAHCLPMPIIEYVYSAHSAFAYLGSQCLSRICADHQVKLIHRPIILSPVVEAQNSTPFRCRTQAHVDYFFGREIERWAEYRDVSILNYRPTHHDADYSIASGMILSLGASGASTDRMAHAILEAHWRDDADISNLKTLSRIATDLGHDPDAMLTQASSDLIQNKLRENSNWGMKRSIFGSPTYIVDGDPFYGQDRLELIEHALSKPFAPHTWSNPSVD